MTDLVQPTRARCAHSRKRGRLRFRWLGWALLGLGCTPRGGTTYDQAVEDFVAAWDIARTACDQQVVCGASPVGPCKTAYRDPEELVSGVKVAHMDVQAMLRCQNSAATYGACLAPLDCVSLTAGTACPLQRWRYAIDCAALHTSLDFLDGSGTGGASAAGGSGGTGGAGPVGGSGGVGGSVLGSLSGALCERAEACTGVRWSTEQTAACELEARALFGPLIPNPSGTQACIEAAACGDLESDVAAVVTTCVDLNQASAVCVDARAIFACTWSGVCTDLPCRDVCSSQGAITLGCGPSPSGSGDACQCG